MDIHYFQRFAQKENLATNNTLLLLQRLQGYSFDIFERVLKRIIGEDFEINIFWKNQVKKDESVPDGQIRQNSFNILIETKMGAEFDESQIQRHINSFDGKCDFQIMLTLSPFKMLEDQEKTIEEYALAKGNVIHRHITFSELIEIIDSELDNSRDYEFYKVLDDFENWCSADDLLSNKDNILRVVPVGMTYDENIKNKLYYDNAKNGYVPHTYIGLYKDKRISQVGKVIRIVEVEIENNKIKSLKPELPEITEEMRQNILCAAQEAKKRGYDIDKGHKFFIVDNFYQTSFNKISKGGLYGKRKLFINTIIDKKISSAEELAKELDQKTWE